MNFGSGIGTVYDPEKDSPADLKKLAVMTSAITAENSRGLNVRMLIETGPFVVCNAGTYYTPIVDIKESWGRKFLIVENGMNGFLRPAIANLLQKAADGRALPGQEPLCTGEHECAIQVLNTSNEKERVSLVGNHCTALDVLAENIELNKAKIGDLIAVTNAGSYANSLSPLLFSSHTPPSQYGLKGRTLEQRKQVRPSNKTPPPSITGCASLSKYASFARKSRKRLKNKGFRDFPIS